MTPSSLSRPLASAGCALVLALSTAPAATAAESPSPTAQAVAYGMDWIPYIDPADLPPVAQRKVVCLVDSGVDITPDLPPDRPEGPIVERVAIDGGSGLGGPAWENQHGTRMALLAGAVPGNDYGTAGAWPAVRIVSVRAMPYGERTFPGAHYDAGVRACNAATEKYSMAAINLSLACRCELDPEERARLEDAIARVQAPDKSVSVVIAAGNDGGGLAAPADARGAFPVAAGDDAGALCAYASFGFEALVGPGCGTSEPSNADAGWSSGGSSGAAAHVSVLLAVLRTLKPHAGYSDAERWVRSGARSMAGRAVLHGEGAAREAGLGPVVDRARGRMPASAEHPPVPTSKPSAAAPDPVSSRVPGIGARARRSGPEAAGSLRAPVARVQWRRAGLRVRLVRRPAGAERLILRASWSDGRTRTARRRLPSRTVLSIQWGARPQRIALTYEGHSPDGRPRRSPTTVMRPVAGGTFR